MAKATQSEAGYGKGDPLKNCGTCIHYQGNHRCARVGGDVSPYGVSQLYQAERSPFGKSLTPEAAAQIKAIYRQSEMRARGVQ